jgi:hypothetical protein
MVYYCFIRLHITSLLKIGFEDHLNRQNLLIILSIFTGKIISVINLQNQLKFYAIRGNHHIQILITLMFELQPNKFRYFERKNYNLFNNGLLAFSNLFN